MSFFGPNSTIPNQTVNSNYTNVSSSNNPMFFGSNETKTDPACYKGGKRTKTKIKNIYRMYKMKTSKRKRSARKNKLMKKYSISRRRNNKKHATRRRMRKHRGGYSQYQSNIPFTANYSTGGILNSNDSALANPVPYTASSSCFDNYNHYTGK